MTIQNIIEIPIASSFDYSNIIDQEYIDNAINIIDKLVDNSRYRSDLPGYQTIDNLFLFDEFLKFEETFISSCLELIKSNYRYTTYAFSYMDWCSNQMNSNRDLQWHKHENSTLVGVFYLKNNQLTKKEYSGTEFADDKLNSIGYINPEPFCWHIFSGNRYHRSGIITSEEKRYVLTGSIKFYE